jgi:hypothetical protein
MAWLWTTLGIVDNWGLPMYKHATLSSPFANPYPFTTYTTQSYPQANSPWTKRKGLTGFILWINLLDPIGFVICLNAMLTYC